MDDADVRVLARLHVECLTDSFVTALGPSYVESFYRYVTRSGKEIAFVERDAAGVIVGATVISLEPATFNRRLLRHTSLLAHAVARATRVLPLLLPRRQRAASTDAAQRDSHLPEMLLIFTAGSVRGRGVGTTLVRRVEDALRARGVREYQVRTVHDPANRALAFYRDRGFVPAGIDSRLGKQFQIFTRTVG